MVYLFLKREVLPEMQRCRIIYMPKKGCACWFTEDI